ncbi:1747_t:CDS:2 [Diversispora eburnea]|uniref:1747_t:CDS:1 n=1 Tax=Diversispora eburnea TaxID=1213867 RepID=A0A9N8WFU1_9GLOM|nr:1747_t:CDS:2 [Diversispora eburnea]
MSNTSKALFLTGGVLSGVGLLYGIYVFSQRFGKTSTSNQGNIAPNNVSTNSSIVDKEIEDATRFYIDNKESQNLLNLLYSIAEDQARKEGYIHRGITCNNCSSSPIRGIRYKCANCVDYDLCELCEGQEVHYKTHTFLKIRIPIPPLANPRSALLNVFYPGRYTNFGDLARDRLRDLQKKTHFDQVELEALYDQFKSLATVIRGEGGIDKGTFEQCLGPLSVERNLVTERIFQFFDQDGDNIINFSELVVGLSVLYAFKGYDLDGDGLISRDELQQIFKAYFHISTELVRDVVKAMEEELLENYESTPSQPVAAAFHAAIPPENNIQYINQKSITEEDNDIITWNEKIPVVECLGQDAIDEIVDKIFKSIDTNTKGYISYDEFKEYVQRDGTIVAWFDVLGR